MRFRFVAFDREQINSEFLTVPFPDHAVLAQAMASFQEHGSDSSRAIVEKYEKGIWRLKPAGHSSGRCLFAHTGERQRGSELLLVLAVYKKESDFVPKRVLRKAESRLKEWKNG